jgi:hypothetical protein
MSMARVIYLKPDPGVSTLRVVQYLRERTQCLEVLDFKRGVERGAFTGLTDKQSNDIMVALQGCPLVVWHREDVDDQVAVAAQARARLLEALRDYLTGSTPAWRRDTLDGVEEAVTALQDAHGPAVVARLEKRREG